MYVCVTKETANTQQPFCKQHGTDSIKKQGHQRARCMETSKCYLGLCGVFPQGKQLLYIKRMPPETSWVVMYDIVE